MSHAINTLKIEKLLKEALTFCQNGNFVRAKKIYENLLDIIPNNPQILTNLGTIELQNGNILRGINFLEKSLKLNPMQPIAASNLANGLLEINNVQDACKYYDLALKLNPYLVDAYYNKARAEKILNNFNEAIFNYEKVLQIEPNHFQARLNLGFLFNQLNEHDKALEQYNLAISINSKSAEAFYNRAIVYDNLKQFNNALKDYDIAIAINNNYVEAFLNKSSTLENIGNFKEALNTTEISLKSNPNNPDLHAKRAFILAEQKNFDCAFEGYDQAIKNNPDFSEALFNKACLKLLLDYYQEGWELYPSRWNNQKEGLYLKTSKPEIKNFDVKNKKILIWGEQGLGDQILYSSMLIDAAKTQNNFIVSLDKRLLPLYERSFHKFNNIKFVDIKESISESNFDYHIPIGDLGKFFRNSIKNFLNQPKNYLEADSDQIKLLRDEIKGGNKFICGLSWKSKNDKIGINKSINLDEFLPIFKLDNLVFIDLQYGDNQNEIKNIFTKYNILMKSFKTIDNYNNIDGLASLISICDFVITVSNVTAHLAGALGKKTFVLLPHSYGKLWYWHENRSESLWYPNLSLYRQVNNGLWSQPIQVLSEFLKKNYVKQN